MILFLSIIFISLLIYVLVKNKEKLKVIFEKLCSFFTLIKTKVMNVVTKIKNFFGERFLRRLPISRASSEESEIAQAGKDNKTAGR